MQIYMHLMYTKKWERIKKNDGGQKINEIIENLKGTTQRRGVSFEWICVECVCVWETQKNI